MVGIITPLADNYSAAYKRLIVRAEIRDGGLGNCIQLEDIPILVGSSRKTSQPELNLNINPVRLVNNEPNEHYDLQTVWNDHEYIMNPFVISDCSLQIIIYIAGFVPFNLQKSIK